MTIEEIKKTKVIMFSKWLKTKKTERDRTEKHANLIILDRSDSIWSKDK